jgi:hypothetical protein
MNLVIVNEYIITNTFFKNKTFINLNDVQEDQVQLLIIQWFIRKLRLQRMIQEIMEDMV